MLRSKSLFISAGLILATTGLITFSSPSPTSLPLIAIANYGPHSSLHDTIAGLKDELARQGLKEDRDIQIEVADVNFEPSLIPQMLSKLKAHKPQVLVTLTTPVAQAAKSTIKDVPLVFAAITDPLEAGLLQKPNEALGNITGATDKQDLEAFLNFVKHLQPAAITVGLLYATGEANDVALVKHIKSAAQKYAFKVVTIPVDQARDIPIRMQGFKDKVDLIYVGVSGPIQPALPAIVAAADKMKIPVYNADFTAVKEHLAFGSFGVNYKQVGANTAKIIKQILEGISIENIPPSHPSSQDHQGFTSLKKAKQLGITLPQILPNTTIVE